MVTRAVRHTVVAGSQYDWRKFFSRLQKTLLVVAAIGLLSMGLKTLNDPQFLPIQKVRAQGAFINLTEAMLLSRAGDIRGGYFNIDVSVVQHNIESLAWVEKANVKKVWPDALMISVTEQNTLAWWQGNSLINRHGELFYPAKKTFPAELPQLNGPLDSHQLLLAHYQRMNAMLTKIELHIQKLDMDARRSIVLQLDNGLKILLGRDTHYPRLHRFIRVYEKLLLTEINQLQQVDMRYTNGFIVLRKP